MKTEEIGSNWYMVSVDDANDNMAMVEIPEDGAVSMAANAMHQGHQNRLELENLAQMVAGVMSDDKNLQFEMTTRLRKLLSIEHNPPINEVVQSGVVPRFVRFLSRDDFPRLQWEAAGALTNIGSGTSEENTRLIIESGAIPLFIKLLLSPKEYVREQAAWTLGKLAGNSPQYRDFILSQGAMFYLLIQFNKNVKLSMLRIGGLALARFCSSPHLALDQILAALLVLQCLVNSTDEQVLIYACSSLSYLSNGVNDIRQTLIISSVVPRLIQLLTHPSPSVFIPSFNTIKYIVKGDDMQKQTLLNSHLLPQLLNLLTNTNYEKSIKQNICGIISNITAAGNTNQIQEVIQSGIITPLIHLLQQGEEFDIKKAALWAISYAIIGGNHDQIKFLVSQGCIEPLCNLLTCPDTMTVTVCLQGLVKILNVGEAEKNLGNRGGDYNLYAHMIDEAKGLEKIENLQSHGNKEIKDKALRILKAFSAQDNMELGEAFESNGSQIGTQNEAADPTGSLLQRLFLKIYI